MAEKNYDPGAIITAFTKQKRKFSWFVSFLSCVAVGFLVWIIFLQIREITSSDFFNLLLVLCFVFAIFGAIFSFVFRIIKQEEIKNVRTFTDRQEEAVKWFEEDNEGTWISEEIKTDCLRQCRQTWKIKEQQRLMKEAGLA